MKNIIQLVGILLMLAAVGFADTETFGGEVDVGNDAPTISASNVTADMPMMDLCEATDPVNAGDTEYFNIAWSDVNGDNVTLFVCDTNGFSGGACTGEKLCQSSSTDVSPAQCFYSANSQVGNDPATSWTAYAFAYDGTDAGTVSSITVYTNHFPTIGGTVDFVGDLVNYANDTVTVNVASLTKADADGDTTAYQYRFLDNDDVSVLQDWSATSTYDCTTDGGGTGNGFCSRDDNLHLDVRVYDNHVNGYSASTKENDTMMIRNSIPSIDTVLMNGVASPTVNPTENGFVNVAVTMNVSDYDIVNDVAELTGGGSNATSTSSYYGTNTSCVYSIIDTDTAGIGCTLTIAYNATGGAKTVTVWAVDKASFGNTNGTQSFTYSSIYTMMLNQSAIDFGSVSSNTLNNPAQLTLNNTGNGICNMTVKGFNLVSGLNTITIGNMTIDDDATAGGGDGGNLAEMTMTTGAQQFNPLAGVAVDGYFDNWYFLDIPIATPVGTYTSTSNFEVVTSAFA
jgi:hypothetical protein